MSLDGMRRMGILVTGAVTRPGRHEVPGSATLFDALMAAGGVDKLGSLRDIRLVRSGSAQSIDFYGLLQGIDGTDPALRDGDRIVVPPIGPTIAIAGQVKRPAIFELPADRQPIALDEAMALAGGPVLPGPTRSVRFTISPEGTEVPAELGDGAGQSLSDGDLLLVSPTMTSASAASPSPAMCAIRGRGPWPRSKRWQACSRVPTCCRSPTSSSPCLRRPIRRHWRG